MYDKTITRFLCLKRRARAWVFPEAAAFFVFVFDKTKQSFPHSHPNLSPETRPTYIRGRCLLLDRYNSHNINKGIAMQTTIELNDAVGPVGSPLPQCVTPPPIPTLESLLGKRHFDDLFEDEVFHAGQQLYLKKCRPVSYSSKTTIGSPGFKRKRTVSFAQNGVSVTRVERREKTLWYSRADLAVMKHTAKRESRQLNLDSTLAPAYGLPNNDYADEDHLPSVVNFVALRLTRTIHRFSCSEHSLIFMNVFFSFPG